MREIDDSDIEYDLGEINMSGGVEEAHSNGLFKVCGLSDDRDYAAASTWVPPEARAAARILISSPSLGATAQNPGRMRGVHASQLTNSNTGDKMQMIDASGSDRTKIRGLTRTIGSLSSNAVLRIRWCPHCSCGFI
jgi:hypothetical protein